MIMDDDRLVPGALENEYCTIPTISNRCFRVFRGSYLNNAFCAFLLFVNLFKQTNIVFSLSK